MNLRDETNEISIIQQTDVDAKLAKRSAAALGYLNDPFIEDFVRAFDRKPPIINRGMSGHYPTNFRHVCSDSLHRSIDRKCASVKQYRNDTDRIPRSRNRHSIFQSSGIRHVFCMLISGPNRIIQTYPLS
jgi:hypothetical protein